jgi:GNAT superfamily N-acetyltransferase
MNAMPNVRPQPDNAVQIRLAELCEAGVVANILRASFDEFQLRYMTPAFLATTPDEERVRIRMQEGPAWVAVVDGAIHGTASAVKKDDGALYIRGMGVLREARGKRIGERLLLEIERHALENSCNRLTLTTTPFLTSALRLYDRFGFRFIAGGPDTMFGTPIVHMEKLLVGESNYYEEHRKEELCRKIMDTLLTGTPACA